MKKYNCLVGIFLAVLVVLCIVLWQQKNAEHRQMEILCQSSISMAFDDFSAYEQLEKDSNYISGVAEFRSFMTAYLFLNNNVSDTNYIWCNTLYGEMLLHPDTVKSNIAELVDALDHLAKDYSHIEGFNKINNFANKLTRDNG